MLSLDLLLPDVKCEPYPQNYFFRFDWFGAHLARFEAKLQHGPVAVSFITDGRCITVVGVDRSVAICQFARPRSVVAHEDLQNCKRIFDAAQIAPSH